MKTRPVRGRAYRRPRFRAQSCRPRALTRRLRALCKQALNTPSASLKFKVRRRPWQSGKSMIECFEKPDGVPQSRLEKNRDRGRAAAWGDPPLNTHRESALLGPGAWPCRNGARRNSGSLLQRGQSLPDGIFGQLRHAVQVQPFHDLLPMRFNGLDAHV